MPYYSQQTDRLILRKMTISDIPIWMEFFIDNPLEHFTGIDISLPTETKARAWVELQLKRYATNDFGHLAAINKETGDMVGVGGLIHREVVSQKELEVAYSIIPRFWGKGYATEIATKLKEYATENQLSDSLISIISVENTASQKVAQKNGMQNSATLIYMGMEVDVYRTA